MAEILVNESGVKVELLRGGQVGVEIGDGRVELPLDAFLELIELLKCSAAIAGRSERLRAMRWLTGVSGPEGRA